jgi:hypothetical protein
MNIHQAIAEGLAEELAPRGKYRWLVSKKRFWRVSLRHPDRSFTLVAFVLGVNCISTRTRGDYSTGTRFYYEDPNLIQQLDVQVGMLCDNYFAP